MNHGSFCLFFLLGFRQKTFSLCRLFSKNQVPKNIAYSVNRERKVSTLCT